VGLVLLASERGGVARALQLARGKGTEGESDAGHYSLCVMNSSILLACEIGFRQFHEEEIQ